MTLTAFEAAARIFETPTRRWETPGELAQHLDRRIIQTPALQLIDQALTNLVDTPDGRLALSMPPQEGKSQRVSRWFPLWALLHNPDLRIAIVSYEHGVARRWGRAIRDEITTHPELGLNVRDDLSAQHEWQIASCSSCWTGEGELPEGAHRGHDGGVYSAGIGGALTGRPVDCISGDTHIECEHGRITAAEAFKRGIKRIRAYDHTTGRAVWRDVEAARRIPSRRVVEILTQSGRTLTCTPDHLVYTRRGYVPAGTLRNGDTLTAVMAPTRVPMRQSSSRAKDGDPQSHPARTIDLLLRTMRSNRNLISVADPLLQMREPHSAKPPLNMLGRMLESGNTATRSSLPAMRCSVLAKAHCRHVLLTGLCERGPLCTDDRQGKQPLQRRQVIREVVPNDPANDRGTRRPQMRRMPGVTHDHLSAGEPNGHEIWAHGASHRRGQGEQPPSESDYLVRELPSETPQVITDTVSVVREVRDGKVAVYDFQVAGTSNFFGNDLLVHNCLIIDDPVKDREQADSETYRERAWDWWTDTGSTRLAPGAPAVIVATRWHEEDLTGKLLEAGKTGNGDEFVELNIPAQADHDPTKNETDPLGRTVGEFMESARRRKTHQWEAIKRRVGSRTWASLYQGRPSPASGDILKREWWQRYEEPLWLERQDGSRIVTGFDDIIMSWDLAFKDTKTSDYVVGQVWARRGANAYLLDQIRDRLDFPATITAFKTLVARWPQATLKLVEDKANGPAVIASLNKSIFGIVPEQPQGSKTARASAVAPLVESGNVWLPASALAPWVDDLIEETAGFPNAAHDDTVDALSQALNRLILQPLLAGDDLTEHPLETVIDDDMAYLSDSYMY